MISFLVGTRILIAVAVSDRATDTAVDPATFTFTLKPPSTAIGYATSTYVWNGTIWTNSESTIAVPSKGSTGAFSLRLTVPYLNIVQGRWVCGWKSTANGSGYGEGSGEESFVALASAAL